MTGDPKPTATIGTAPAMRAVRRDRYGPPACLTMADMPLPVPGAAEVRVRIHAAGINASDWEILRGKPLYGRIGGLFTPSHAVLGSDVAGVVDAVGEGVTEFETGDAVYGDVFGTWGCFAEQVCAPVKMLRKKPDFLSFAEAAALPQSATIAWQGMTSNGGFEAGAEVLINGAGGGCGVFAVQFAKALGAQVTAVDHGDKCALLRELGADHFVDFTAEDVTRAGRRYDRILDLVGHHSIGDFSRAMKPGGRYFMVGGSMGLLFGTLTLGSLSSLFTSRKMGVLFHRQNEGYEAIEEYIESGAMRVVVDAEFTLEQTPAALQRLGDGRAAGKLVVLPGESQ